MHALRALIAINGKASRGVNRPATVFKQRPAKRLVSGTECDGVDESAFERAKSNAYVVLANRIGESDRVIGQREDRLGIAGTIRPAAGQQIAEVHRNAGSTYRPVDQEYLRVAPQ